MTRQLQRSNGVQISSIVRTFSYEDQGAEIGHFESKDSLIQKSDATKIAELDSVYEIEDMPIKFRRE